MMNIFHNSDRTFSVVHAYRYDVGVFYAAGMQHVGAGGVAVIDFETVFACDVDDVGIVVQNGNGGTVG